MRGRKRRQPFEVRLDGRVRHWSRKAGRLHALEASDSANAAREADASLKLQPNAEAYLVKARLALAQHNNASASESVDAALKLEPANSAAQSLKRSIESKVSEAPSAEKQPD